MKFLIADKTDETKNSAAVLKTSIAGGDPVYFAENCFQNANLQDIQDIAFLAHANPSQFGDFDKDRFIKTFVSAIQTRFGKNISQQDKDKIEHIYLIGCEVGLRKKGACLAQAIADELYKQGFHKAKVHAIACPEDAYAKGTAGMRVEITTQAGIGGIAGGFAGQVTAYWLTQKQEVSLINDSSPKNKRKVVQEVYESGEQVFFKSEDDVFQKTGPVLDEMREQCNTFIPAQIPQAPRDAERFAALNAIKKRINVLKNQKTHGSKDSHGKIEKKLKFLSAVKEKIENETRLDWKQHIKAALDEKNSSNNKIRLNGQNGMVFLS